MTEPTDAEIAACIEAAQVKCVHPDAETTIEIARAVLAKWGTPAVAGEPVMWAYQYSDGSWHDASATEHSAGMKPLYPAPQPAQAQAGLPWLWVDEVRQYLTAAADSSMSRNNSEQLASELLEQMPTKAQAEAVPMSHEDAKALVRKYGNDPLHLVLQVERHHGIKGGQHDADAIRKLKEDTQ